MLITGDSLYVQGSPIHCNVTVLDGCSFIFAQLKAEAPKPPLSAYMLFCRAKREKVHRKHPKLSSKEVTVKLSKKWKSMGEEDKVHVRCGSSVTKYACI